MTKVREVTKEEGDWFKDNFRYDPDTGYLWWTKRGNGRQTDRPVGTLDNHGYLRTQIKRKPFKMHRLAWFLYHGVWPKKYIDHINGVKNDNRIENLREATQSENQGNMKIRKGGTSMYKGVSWSKRYGKWQAQIGVKYRTINLGYYDNEEEAALVYNKAALEFFGGYAKINDLTP